VATFIAETTLLLLAVFFGVTSFVLHGIASLCASLAAYFAHFFPEIVTKLPLPSFLSLFFLPFRYNMPFLCPHVTCQQSRVRLFQPHSNPQQAAQLSGSVRLIPASLQTTCPPFSDTTHATLPQEACHSPSLSAFHIQLLRQLSHRTAHSAYCPYCPS